jgi:hypothetical protein
MHTAIEGVSVSKIGLTGFISSNANHPSKK